MLIQRTIMDAFERGDVTGAAANVVLPGDAVNAAGRTTTDSNALVTENGGQAQNTNNATTGSEGAAGTGADPLNSDKTVEGNENNNQPDGTNTTDDPNKVVEGESQNAEENQTGEPGQDADLQKVRNWGRGLKADLEAIRPVVDKVQELGGIERVTAATTILDSFAAADFNPEDTLGIFAQLSPSRYTALLESAFKQHQDVFLNALGLNAQQFKAAAQAVKDGRPVNEEDIASAQIPFGMSSEDWDNLSKEAQTALREQAKQSQLREEAIATQQRKELETTTQRSQENWAQSIDTKIAKICDSLKIASDAEGEKLRERIRRNVYATLTSDQEAAPKFYSVLKHYGDLNPKLAEGLQPGLANLIERFATEEAQYATKVQRLENEIAQLKLSRANGKIEVPNNAVAGGLNANAGNRGNQNLNGLDPSTLFDRDSVKQSANTIIGSHQR